MSFALVRIILDEKRLERCLMYKKLRTVNNVELLVGVGFALIGFFVGSSLIKNTANHQIKLNPPEEVSDSESNPYLGESLIESEGTNNIKKSVLTETKQRQDSDPSAVSSSPESEFTNLSQEEKNCVIWKNAYPEAAYKLKQGDACY